MRKPDKKCEPHDKNIYHSIEHAIGGAVFLAEKAGTARIYWDEQCQCYHLTKQSQPLTPREKNDG